MRSGGWCLWRWLERGWGRWWTQHTRGRQWVFGYCWRTLSPQSPVKQVYFDHTEVGRLWHRDHTVVFRHGGETRNVVSKIKWSEMQNAETRKGEKRDWNRTKITPVWPRYLVQFFSKKNSILHWQTPPTISLTTPWCYVVVQQKIYQ